MTGVQTCALPICFPVTIAGVYMERAFAPKSDMEEKLRNDNIPLFTLETKTPLRELDAIGFSLSYEMTYTNVLNMLDLAGIPIERKDRGEDFPIVMAGGTGAYNPKVLSEYVDAFMMGEGEEVIREVAELLKENKALSRNEKLNNE